MSLPILQTRAEPTDADLVRLFHRTEAHWVENLADPTQLEAGTAYSNAELSEVWDANHVRDAALHGDLTAGQAVAEIDAHYSAAGTRCAYWVMNPSAGAGQTRALIDYLMAAGFVEQRDDILHLRKAVEPSKIAEVAGLQIIPARASYRHLRELAAEKAAERWGGGEQLVEAAIRQVDNPHFDALLALKEGRAVALLGVLAAGEIGRIESVYVAPDFRRQGIGTIMMQRALEICARSLFRHVFILVEPGNPAAQALYRKFGFAKLGELVSYRAPAAR